MPLGSVKFVYLHHESSRSNNHLNLDSNFLFATIISHIWRQVGMAIEQWGLDICFFARHRLWYHIDNSSH